MSRPVAKALRLFEDDRVIVTRFDFEPGAETGWHRHNHDYVITTLTRCMMTLETADGAQDTDTPAGTAYRRNEGVEHNVINRSDTVMSFVEVELK